MTLSAAAPPASPQEQPRALLARNPAHMRGRARVRGTNILTSVIHARWQTGETYEAIAHDYGRVTTEQVIAAVHYELGLRARNDYNNYWRAMEEL